MEWSDFIALLQSEDEMPGITGRVLAEHCQTVLGYTPDEQDIAYLVVNLDAGISMAVAYGEELPRQRFNDSIHRLMEHKKNMKTRTAEPSEIQQKVEKSARRAARRELSFNMINYGGMALAVLAVVVMLLWGFVLDKDDDQYPEQTNWNAHFAPMCDQERKIGLYVYYTDGGFYGGSIPMDADQFAQECARHAPE